MPKETIRDERDWPKGNDCTTHVEVGWQREQSVQLGLHMPFKTLTFLNIDPATGEGKPEMITPTVSNLFNSLWVDLNRAQINHLIRALRKARDQAYGADA